MKVEDKVTRLGAQRIEEGDAGVADAVSGGAQLCSAQRERKEEERGRGKWMRPRTRIRTSHGERGSPRRPTRGVAGASPVAAWALVRSQCDTGNWLTHFDSILTG